jgi:Beta-propeller repeat
MKRDTYLRGVPATSLSLALFALISIGFQPKAQAQAAKTEPANVPTASKQHLAEEYGKLPLAFEANTGQTSDDVKFLSRGQGYTLFLTRNAETVLVLSASAQKETSERPPNAPPVRLKPRRESTPPWVVRMNLLNADVTSQAEGLEELPGKANYFVGNDPGKWRTNVPLFSRVQYRNVYPGVDLVYYGNQNQVENDFIVAPGADPQSITLSFTGAEKLSLDSQGNLVLAAKEGEVRFERPRIYQDVNGTQLEISGDYLLKDVHQVGFQVAAYDRSRPLVIDPVLSYSTYLGGSAGAYGIAVDSSGNAYLTGFAGSANFPTTPGAFQATPHSTNGAGNAFVTKLNPAGSALVYSTYLGGSGGGCGPYHPGCTAGDQGAGIAVDAAGNAYVTGWTVSTDFPTTLGAFQTNNRGWENAFVTKLNSDGTTLLYSTYLGGSTNGYVGDQGHGIALDTQNNVYVTGTTCSSDFPVTPNAFQSIYKGCNAFMSELNTTALLGLGPVSLGRGSASLVYSTYLGGTGGDSGESIALDAAGNAYVTGWTDSTDFPVTPGAFQMSYKGSAGTGNAFVSKLNPAEQGPLSLVYSTYLGGASGDRAFGIAVDNQGSAYVTGDTCSTNFPVTPLAFKTTSQNLDCNAFVTKFDPSGSSLDYSTYLGGTRGAPSGGTSDYGFAIAVDGAGDAYVTGQTISADFPTTPDAFQLQPAKSPAWTAYMTVLNSAGSGLVYSTYLSGSGSDSGESIAVDNVGNAYVTGTTYSTDFPTTPGTFQTTFQGYADAFVAKFSGFPTAP